MSFLLLDIMWCNLIKIFVIHFFFFSSNQIFNDSQYRYFFLILNLIETKNLCVCVCAGAHTHTHIYAFEMYIILLNNNFYSPAFRLWLKYDMCSFPLAVFLSLDRMCQNEYESDPDPRGSELFLCHFFCFVFFVFPCINKLDSSLN